MPSGCWQDNADLPLKETVTEEWLADYAERRYGVKDAAAEKAMNILSETVYNGELNMKGQGAPEAVTNARPTLA